MKCEVVAVGTELLLGQIVDTNSAVIGEKLAEVGIDSYFQTKVGDNLERATSAVRLALSRSDAVIVCGGLGPTHDDLTRAVLARVMGVELERDPVLVDMIRAMFATRNRRMPANNLAQADVPVGATPIEQRRGTAPGLICPVKWEGPDGEMIEKTVYAMPGVPYEMAEMLERAVIPDLRSHQGAKSVIVSRTLRTWGESESGLAERLSGNIAALDGAGNATIAFLASGIEGIKVRVTAKADTIVAADKAVADVERVLRDELGNLIFGVDDETMESTIIDLLRRAGFTLALAESVTGGMIGARITNVPGASDVFRGGLISYASDVKFSLLGVPEGPVVNAETAEAMASGVRRLLGADVGLAITGVAGPAGQDGVEPGTVFVGWDVLGVVRSKRVSVPGDRERIRMYASITALDLLRHDLIDRPANPD